MMNWVKLGCFSVQSQTIFRPNFSFYFLFLGVALSNVILINHSSCNNLFYGVLNYIYTSESSLLLLLIFFFFFFFFLSEGCIKLSLEGKNTCFS